MYYRTLILALLVVGLGSMKASAQIVVPPAYNAYPATPAATPYSVNPYVPSPAPNPWAANPYATVNPYGVNPYAVNPALPAVNPALPSVNPYGVNPYSVNPYSVPNPYAVNPYAVALSPYPAVATPGFSVNRTNFGFKVGPFSFGSNNLNVVPMSPAFTPSYVPVAPSYGVPAAPPSRPAVLDLSGVELDSGR